MHPVGPSLVPDQTRLRDIDLTEYARRLAKHSAVYPRVQVVEAAGKFYATNHLNLALCRYLERAGYCREVRVTVCPACSIPAGLRAVLCEDRGAEATETAGSSGSSSDSEPGQLHASDSMPSESCSLSYCSLCDKEPEVPPVPAKPPSPTDQPPAFSVPCQPAGPPTANPPVPPFNLEPETECLL